MRNIDRILVVAGVSHRIIPTEGVFQELVLMDQHTGETLTFPLVAGQYELMQEFYTDDNDGLEEDTVGGQNRGSQGSNSQGSATESREGRARQSQEREIGSRYFAGAQAQEDWQATQAAQEAGRELAREGDQGQDLAVNGENVLRAIPAPNLVWGGVKGMSDF